jgi:hypothetical protein
MSFEDSTITSLDLMKQNIEKIKGENNGMVPETIKVMYIKDINDPKADLQDNDKQILMQLLNESPMDIDGGRRHKGSKKMHKGKRHGNASLRAWVTFVKKVQKEEGVSYKEAMSVAKKRKDSGEKWRGGDSETIIEDTVVLPEERRSESMEGGRRRRRSKKHRGSKKCGGSKKRRHSRRH